MTLTPEDVEKIREIIESRSARTDEAIGKLEERMFNEIEKVALQVSKLSDGQQSMNDRTTKLESANEQLLVSRTDQGKRIGAIELKLENLAGRQCGEDGAKGKTGEWVRWVVPVLLTIGAGISGVIIGGSNK